MNEKYWIIGAIIGAVIYAITGSGLVNLGPISSILYLPLIFIPGVYGSEIILPIGIVTGFIIGSIIGLVYGKIRNRKQVGMTVN